MPDVFYKLVSLLSRISAYKRNTYVEDGGTASLLWLTEYIDVGTVITYFPGTQEIVMNKAARTVEIKVIAIGNSRGVRLPKAVLAKYAIQDSLIMEEREDGLLLRGKHDRRLSWEATYKEMAGAHEDWSDMDSVLHDGLKKEPW